MHSTANKLKRVQHCLNICDTFSNVIFTDRFNVQFKLNVILADPSVKLATTA